VFEPTRSHRIRESAQPLTKPKSDTLDLDIAVLTGCIGLVAEKKVDAALLTPIRYFATAIDVTA
jgi:hypothetical protein